MKDNTIPLTLISILADGEFHSGEQLGEQLGMSRAGINKHIQTLRDWGVDVFTVPGKGYSLPEPIQLLNEDVIRSQIGHGNVAVLPVIDSTNQYLLDRLPELKSGDACVAEYQQAGRGRRGRKWFSPFGANLYLSMYWRLDQGPAAAIGLSLVIGIVMAEVLHDLGADRVRVKWPNDLYLNDRKLAGILVELTGKTGDAAQIVIGAGLNMVMRTVQNDVVNQALSTARKNLADWNMVRADSILENWVFQAAFFNSVYSKEDFETNEDLTSVFDKQWRTTVQEVDLENPIPMSNGTAYRVTKMKIPTNVLIYRLKELFRNYEYLSASDKEKYFNTTNLSFEKISETDEATINGWPALGFPKIGYRVLYFTLTDLENKNYMLDYTPFRGEMVGKDYVATSYKIPPGTYTFAMGFRQAKDLGAIDFSIFKDGEEIQVGTFSQSKLNNNSALHYDRGKEGGYPENIDEAVKQGFKDKAKYDRDGGTVGTVTIPGDKASEIVIRFKGSGSNLKHASLYHWCLRPTKDCY